MKIQKHVLLLLFVLINFESFAQQGITSGEKEAVISRIEKLMDSIYVFVDVAAEATNSLSFVSKPSGA